MIKLAAILIVVLPLLHSNGNVGVVGEEICGNCRDFLLELFEKELYSEEMIGQQKELLRDNVCRSDACRSVVDSEWDDILKETLQFPVQDLCSLLSTQGNECEEWDLATVTEDKCSEHIVEFLGLLNNVDMSTEFYDAVGKEFCLTKCHQDDVECLDLCNEFTQTFLPEAFGLLMGVGTSSAPDFCYAIIN